jgi:folate-binding protein YgfZ
LEQGLLVACLPLCPVIVVLYVVVTGEVAPLECNLDALAGISYTKGCYIGQERNSYTHYRGIIRKRMMPVLLPGLEPSARELQGMDAV